MKEGIEQRTVIIPHHGRSLYGIFKLPKGVEYPAVVIFSHGYNGSGDDFETMSDFIVAHGYAAFCLDFCGGSVKSRSSMATTEMTIFTEEEDLVAAVQYLQTSGETGAVYLFGGSQGGLVSALTAADLGEQIKGLVLMFPATCIADNWNMRFARAEDIPQEEEVMGMRLGRHFFEVLRDFNTFEKLKEYQGRVLITHGDQDMLVPMEYSERLSRIYCNAVYHVYAGEGHGYTDAGNRRMQEELLAFLEEGER